MKRHVALLLAVVGLTVFCQPAWADAGTPLMWAGMFHLLMGNAIIGIAEGVLLSWLFRAPIGKSIPVLVLANYTSTWIGAFFIRGVNALPLPVDLNNGWMWYWLMVVATYFITLLIEWPFFAWLHQGK